MKKPNFSGWATKYGVLCTDGRTIVADAFSLQHGKKIPLQWRHDDKTPTNTLGHVILEHVAGVGIRCDAYFNATESGKHSQGVVEHGDINMLSIKAVHLQQSGSNVTGGVLTEVSLVPNGANKDARIESVYLEHEGEIRELEDQGIIFSGIEITHADDAPEASAEAKPTRTTQEVYDSFDPEQLALVEAMLNAVTEGDDAEGDEAEQEESTAGGEIAQEDAEDGSDTIEQEGESMSNTRNVFDQTANKGTTDNGVTLTHEELRGIYTAAMKHETGKLTDHLLEHAAPYGITNIEALFPHSTTVTNTPEWVKRDDSWVNGVLASVKRVPFSRIKSWTADVTHEEARAKGYITGTMKKEEYYAIAHRETSPTTIYKKQKLDRDNILDATTFDVVSWMKDEMRWMLMEEMARAFLFGDGRDPGDPDKVKAINIRPIAYDDDFYTTKILINANLATKSLARRILRARKFLKGGTGRATLYTNDDLIIDLLLMEDQLGRRYYETEATLAAALGVKNIVDCDVLDEGYTDTAGNVLMGVMVNLNDYWVGTDRGGEVTMFDAFDIDFNQNKWLIETRSSGALTKHHSAISIWSSNAARILPEEPDMTATNQLTIPLQDGVTFLHKSVGNDDVDVSGETITLTSGNTPYTVVAEATTGYRFPLNVTVDWTFNWTDPEG